MDNRKRLIREVLDEDMNINKRVADITRQKVMGIAEEVSPYVQLNQEEFDKMGVSTTALRQILEKKALLSHRIVNTGDVSTKYFVEVSHVEDVVAAYNATVTLYLNPRNTQQTRATIGRTFGEVEPLIQQIHGNLGEIIRGLRTPRELRFVNIVIYGYALYEIIQNQYASGNFHVIRPSDIMAAFQQQQRAMAQSQSHTHKS